MNRIIRLVGISGVALTMGIGGLTSAAGANSSATGKTDLPAVAQVMAMAAASPGELTYIAITPCRIVDTRETTSFTANTTRNFKVRGTTGFVPQGGKSGGCSIPIWAMAADLLFTTDNAEGSGRINAYPGNQTEPQSNVMYYPGTNNSTSSATIKLAPKGSSPDIKVHNYHYTTDLIIDVTGYYVEQIHAKVRSSGTVEDRTNRILSSTKLNTGIYQLTTDRDLEGCVPIATVWGGNGGTANAAVTGSNILVYTYVVTGAGAVSTNLYFTVNVNC